MSSPPFNPTEKTAEVEPPAAASEERTTEVNPPAASDEVAEKHGTKLVGPPSVPTAHPQNQQAAAVWGPHRRDEESAYVDRSPVQKPSGSSMEGIYDAFNPTEKTAEVNLPTAASAEKTTEVDLPVASVEVAEKHGTKLMGPPSVPAAHPQNQQAAAVWGPHRGDEESAYVDRSPVQKPSGSPMEGILDAFNSWGKNAETLASNVWDHLKTAPSKKDAAWGKLQLTAKAITEGGFESLFRQTFDTEPSEKLKKTFACYLSTSTGPVAGTLYLSNIKIAFCSDRPLSFTAPSGQVAWSYYKMVVPLSKVAVVSPVTVTPEKEKAMPEKYVKIVTVDQHEFWFMGFVNYDKASKHLLDAVADYTVATPGAQPVVVGE